MRIFIQILIFSGVILLSACLYDKEQLAGCTGEVVRDAKMELYSGQVIGCEMFLTSCWCDGKQYFMQNCHCADMILSYFDCDRNTISIEEFNSMCKTVRSVGIVGMRR